MKKITLSIGLLMGILSSNAQDTTCTYFKGKQVYEFNYKTSEILYKVEFKYGNENQNEKLGKYYEINLEYGDVLCLHLSDKKNRVRNVIATYFDGTIEKNILTSKDNVYYSNQGVVKVLVGRPRTTLISRY
jgi:hypothetical protein